MADVPRMMRAVVIEKTGKPKVLKYTARPLPQPGAGEALVKVHAASVNPADLLYRSGHLIIRKPMPHILGADVAGEIAQVANGVGGWQAGDRVAAAFDELGRGRDGGYAEYCIIPAKHLVRLPDELDYQTAVAAGASFMNAWAALVGHGGITNSDRAVIHAATGGIGTAAVQIASVKGAQVIAIGSGEHAAALRELGADVVLDDASSDLVRQVKMATDERGATLALHGDSDKLQQSIDMLACKGRLVIPHAGQGRDVCLNVMDVYLKSLSILGACDQLEAQQFADILRGLERGSYQAVMDEVMPLSQVRKAHEKLERHAGFGKVVLAPDAILEAAKKPANWIPIE